MRTFLSPGTTSTSTPLSVPFCPSFQVVATPWKNSSSGSPSSEGSVGRGSATDGNGHQQESTKHLEFHAWRLRHSLFIGHREVRLHIHAEEILCGQIGGEVAHHLIEFGHLIDV